jgi:hypothetical protein
MFPKGPTVCSQMGVIRTDRFERSAVDEERPPFKAAVL